MGVVMANLRPWFQVGVRFTVMFAQVPEEQKEICWKNFYASVNEYLDEKLGPGRRGRQVVSLDAMMEEDYLPAEAMPSAASVAMAGLLYDELVAVLGKMCLLYVDILRMCREGLSRKEIVDRLPVKKSQGYDLYRKCREEAERWLRDQGEEGIG